MGGHPGAVLLSEVAGVHAAYCHAIDSGDAEAWAQVFHPQGTSAGPGRSTLRGHEALRAFIRDHHQPHLVHVTVNSLITQVRGIHIHTAARFLILEARDDGSLAIVMTGVYTDVLVRHDERLCIRSRRAVLTPDRRR